MSTEIIVTWDVVDETNFPLDSRVFDLVCTLVGQSAEEISDGPVAEFYRDAIEGRRLLLVYAT